jgi:flagellar hook-length control protein FliK
MMSAKTVLTETPACPTPAVPNNAATAAAPSGAPSDFQNLLAGAVPPVAAPSVALPTQPLAQLLTLKQQAGKATAAAETAANATGLAGKPGTVSPADLLEILNNSATLLPNAGDAEATALQELPTEQPAVDEPSSADEELLLDWFGVILPPSVIAPQAGSMSAQTAAQGEGGQNRDALLTAIPASLLLQAGSPDSNESVNSGATATPGIPIAINREAAAAAAQNSAAAFAAGLGPKPETTDTEAPSTDSWMSAMGDLTGKRAPDAAPVSDARLPTPVHDARWADALAHRLVLMARDGESVASLKLVPVDLGPLDIQISVRDGEASVHFGAAHQETRAVLESSMPRLRELLSAQGLQLANASVSHQSAGQHRPERSSAGGSIGAVADDTEVASAQVISTSLLDIYA